MASPSSSKRGKEKVAQITRNASPSGWISDRDTREKFLYWSHVKNVVPHKYLDLQLFKNEGFLFQEWIAYQGLTDFLQMKGHCYPDLVKVFYTNLRVVNGVIHSRVKSFNITIDDNVWSDIPGLKVQGLDSHIRDSESNRFLTKRVIYINCLRYPGRYMVDKQYLHDGLNKEEKMISYVLTWLLLPGRLNEDNVRAATAELYHQNFIFIILLTDRMSTEDVFLLNAIKTRIPTNLVAILKHHMIAAGDDYARKLPYGVFISKVLELQGVDVYEEERIMCKRSEEISIPSLSSIGLKKTVNGWFFIDEQTVGTPPTIDQDHTESKESS
ncbi:hypothetical protein LR48_Vigan09g053100 [Vigna angularis]|uniref:Uncharacterized protein n=1 Tax=Phaseolus angularis TaxID=3914 RepID=A0A0L9VAB9_PHAAN|nr:hypothetical protein LR48_Vigan09g053100 [Vigna angularis]